MADLSIMYQPLDGGWVKLGTQHGGGRGVVVESIRLEGDRGEGGCLSASFKLKQDPRWIQTQMEKATPIVVMDGAEPVWSGRIAETPMTFGEDDIEVGVNLQGWWQHLKDDCTDREWVIADLSRFVNTAALLDVAVANFQGSAPEIGSGAIILPAPQSSAAITTRACSATFDVGENNKIKKAVVGIRQNTAPGSASWSLIAQISDTADPVAGPAITTASQASPAGSTLYTLTPSDSVGGRYLHVMWYWAGATITSLSADLGCRVESASIFTDASDESGNASILKASTVISETLDACAPLISPDRSRITTTALNLPQFPGSPGWRYADELIKQANAPHGYLARLTPDPVPVFEYQPIPTDYRFVLGEGEYTLLEPAAQALQGVGSRVITEFEDAAGVRSYAEALSTLTRSSTITVPNPSFATNTSSWAPLLGTLTRDTGVFNSSPASGRLNPTAGEAWISNTITGLTPGRRYRVQFKWRRESTITSGYGLTVGNDYRTGSGVLAATTLGVFEPVWLDFIAPAGGSISVGVNVANMTGLVLGYVDDFEVLDGDGTLTERRGFTRTLLRPMSQRSTQATAQAIADLELSAAQYPPFKGTIGVTGRIPLKGGGSMDVSHLPACVGDNIVLSNLHDPNTQSLGRIGNIQAVVYDHDKRQAIIGIDRDLSFITQLRERLSILAR